MFAKPSKHVLVVGTAWANSAKRQAARMIGATLAECGFGLVCGNASGIDRWVAESYCGTLAERGGRPEGAFLQLALGASRVFRRGGLPFAGYAAPKGCRVAVADMESWKREAIARCDAAVMVGGGHGALDIAMRVIAQGRPIFPLPFLGGLTGNSDEVFRQILRTWDGYPVPGVSRTQFLRLAEPWVVGTGPLRNLLRGTLAEVPDIFISYRRNDAPAAAGRIASALGEHFGARRVFLDIQGIAPSQAWDATIEGALAACKAGVVVIGRSWLGPGHDGTTPRLKDSGDVVRSEIAALLAKRKAIFPVLVESAPLPQAEQLPDDLGALLRFQAISIGNGDWDSTVALLIRVIESHIEHPGRPAAG
jgi:predicted Rossmann-fold nucleotide-binding protein